MEPSLSVVSETKFTDYINPFILQWNIGQLQISYKEWSPEQGP